MRRFAITAVAGLMLAGSVSMNRARSAINRGGLQEPDLWLLQQRG